MDRKFAVLYAVAFLDLCGVGMVTMQLSNHLRQLGASHSMVGYIGSIYGSVQLFSSPMIGTYADKHSKRSTLLCCFLLCGVGYLLLGYVSNFWLIAFLRIYLGVFKHPLNLIQSALSDLTKGQSSELESASFGYYQSACSLAFIISPPIAGYLMQTDNGYLMIGVCVAVIHVINTALIYLYLPADGIEANKYTDSGDLSKVNRGANGVGSGAEDNRLTRPVIQPTRSLTQTDMDLVALSLILGSRFLLGVTGHLWRFTYSLLYREVHQLSPIQIGWLVSFNGLVQMTIGSLMKYVSIVIPNSFHQLLISCLVSAVAMVTIAHVSGLAGLYIIIVCMSAATTVSKVSSQSFTYQVLGKEHTGSVVGISGSIMSAARMVTPLVAGQMMEHYSMTSTLYSASLCTLAAASIYIIVYLYNNHKNKTKIE